MLSRELERCLAEAAEGAKSARHEYVTLEHILLSMTRSAYAVEILEGCGANVPNLIKKLRGYVEKNSPIVSEDQMSSTGGDQGWMPEFTMACHRVLQRAAFQVQSAGKREVNEANVLVALFHEKNSQAIYLLNQEGVTQFEIIQFISHGSTLSKDKTIPARAHSDSSEQSERDDRKSALEEFCISLNEKVMKGKSDPLIGRDDVVERTIQVLSRRTKNNPLLIGEPGVGKTAIAEGVAQKIVAGQVPEHLKKSIVYSLDLGLLISGTKFRGDFEGRLKNIMKELKERVGSILFIDEIHTIVGAGSTSGGSMDASNLLKPALADGSISCMGSTTYAEFRQHFEKDRALNRRFQRIDVKEPSISDCKEILKGLKANYEKFFQITYTDRALEAAVELSAKFINGKHLPDKAIDVIDEAGAMVKINPQLTTNNVIDELIIEKVVAKIAQVPVGAVTVNDLQQLKNLDKKLRAVIFGQDEAIDKLVSMIKLSRTGLNRENKPIGSFLFSGPTGVGKTEVTKQLALLLGVPFVRFDMSEYMEKHTLSRLVGAPPGYVGFEEGGLLTEAINKNPHCVLLLDEIEKAHGDLMSVLLQVMDAGRLTDSNGRLADFKNVIVIMTTNAGAQEVAKGSIGIGPSDRSGISMEAIKRTFSPEFLNRLDAIVSFKDLDDSVIIQVVDKFLHELSVQLMEKKISLEVNDEARKWLVKRGYDKAYGARPMGRAIDEHIKKPLVDEILFGKLVHGGQISVSLKDNRLSFSLTPLTPLEEKRHETV
jgi:ATP-dependent Clp protease ATP-binding subunit ClpA